MSNKKTQRALEAKKANGAHQTDARKLQIKTERLRALRLEKEAADLKAEIDRKLTASGSGPA